MTILPASYLGSFEYFHHLINDQCTIEQCANYIRQTPTNRCVIGGANGAQILTIPVIKPKGKTPVKNILIDNKTDWQTQHWRAIESAYNSAPFFEYFKDELQPFYQKSYNKLIDFILDTQKCVLNMIEYHNITYNLSSNYINTEENSHFNINDLREIMLGKKKSVPLQRITCKPYYQVFAHKLGFIENLSIIDLIFNMGMESRILLKKQEQE